MWTWSLPWHKVLNAVVAELGIHYLFREASRITDNVQGQTSKHIFAPKLRLLCLLSTGFKNWGIFAHLTCLDQSHASENI